MKRPWCWVFDVLETDKLSWGGGGRIDCRRQQRFYCLLRIFFFAIITLTARYRTLCIYLVLYKHSLTYRFTRNILVKVKTICVVAMCAEHNNSVHGKWLCLHWVVIERKRSSDRFFHVVDLSRVIFVIEESQIWCEDWFDLVWLAKCKF
jgi:hypothetical protein